MGTLREDLAGPGVEIVETHVSRVFLRPHDVLKVKRAVDLGFLDFSTVAKRRAACEAEVELNRRLAPPGVYLGVVPILRDEEGRHRVGFDEAQAATPGRALVDHAVWMRRLDAAQRADRLVVEDRLGEAELEAIAVRVARFHAAARADSATAAFGRREAIERNVRENFDQTRERITRYLDPALAAEVERWQLDFLSRRAALLATRVDEGRIRDGHGDLRLEHVYLDPASGVVIVDCIEFNDRFRFADVAADVAFLAMDLTRLGRADLAERFLALYARESDDYGLFALIDFYESYRAWVRGKVAAFVADDAGLAAELREQAAGEARRYFLLALASERRPLLPPALIAVGGTIATGKSTVAEWISGATGGPAIDADRTRKRLLGVEPTTPLDERPFAGAYDPAATDRVYAELLRRADTVLDSGRPAVLDASFRARRHREAARRLARERGVAFTFVECRAPAQVCRDRLVDRRRRRGVSDGRLEIFEDFTASWEEADDLAGDERLVLDTTRDPGELRAELRRRLATWPAALRG